jgi:arylsulfatase
MSLARNSWPGLLVLAAPLVGGSLPAAAQQQKPIILFIMGGDIGWMQPSIYHRGLMVGKTPASRVLQPQQVLEEVKQSRAAASD